MGFQDTFNFETKSGKLDRETNADGKSTPTTAVSQQNENSLAEEIWALNVTRILRAVLAKFRVYVCMAWAHKRGSKHSSI